MHRTERQRRLDISDDKVQTCVECGHSNPVGEVYCEARGAYAPFAAKVTQLAKPWPMSLIANQQRGRPQVRLSQEAGDAMGHIVIGLVVIAIAAISYFAGCPIVWIGGFLWGAFEIIRGLAMLGGAGGGGLP